MSGAPALKLNNKPAEFASPLKGMKWTDMSLSQRVQAMMSQGKDAQKFQTMAQKATSNLAKAANASEVTQPNTEEVRKPKEIELVGRTYNIDYLMNALGIKKDDRKAEEDGPMSAYDSELRSGFSNNKAVHNHTREGKKFKHASEETPKETSNSGVAGSLDYAMRNVDGMKRHMRAANIGKRLPGKRMDKEAAFVGYFLAGLMKSAGDSIPDFEKQPELLIPFLEGFAKSAGLGGMLSKLVAPFRSFTSAATGGMGYETPKALQQMIGQKATPSAGMNKNLVPEGGQTIAAPRPKVLQQRAAGNAAMGQ